MERASGVERTIFKSGGKEAADYMQGMTQIVVLQKVKCGTRSGRGDHPSGSRPALVAASSRPHQLLLCLTVVSRTYHSLSRHPFPPAMGSPSRSQTVPFVAHCY